MTTSDGTYVNGTQIAAGDMAGPDSARMVLKNPRVDVAVQESARGGIQGSGLGFDRCNVAVVTNVASDHLGLKGVDSVEGLARVQQVVPPSVLRDGASVLNADNHYTVAMEKYARGEVIFFSMDENNPVIRTMPWCGVRRRAGDADPSRSEPGVSSFGLLSASMTIFVAGPSARLRRCFARPRCVPACRQTESISS